MRKINSAVLTVLSLVIISGVIFNSAAFASSLNSTRQIQKISSSEIPKSVLRRARVHAEASVLDRTDDQVHGILMSHQLDKILSEQGLDHKTFREDVRVEMTAYLTSRGFSQSQILSALNSKYIKSHKNNI